MSLKDIIDLTDISTRIIGASWLGITFAAYISTPILAPDIAKTPYFKLAATYAALESSFNLVRGKRPKDLTYHIYSKLSHKFMS